MLTSTIVQLGAVGLLACISTAPPSLASTELSMDTDPGCDFFVSMDGDDDEEGTEYKYPKETLKCALDANCNNGLEADMTICLLPGLYEVYDTIRPACTFHVNVRAYKPGTVTLDGMGQTNIISVGRTPASFFDIAFVNGKGTTGACVYGEAHLDFTRCSFTDSESDVDGAAVMVMRTATFTDCSFTNNEAMFGGAVRVSDIGGATFNRCKFYGNKGIRKGGAIITQVEKPDENEVLITDTLFCFNESPEGRHIYNFRDATHKCVRCQFNSKACCSDHGRVVKDKATEAKLIAAKEIKDAADKKADEEKAAEKAAAKAAKAAARKEGDEDEEEEEEDSRGGWSGDVEVAAVMMCACDDGWEGATCDTAAGTGAGKDEL